ncbi:chloroplast stem-loop binding protein of 41 kDa b, chloroplastic [Hordeum vulgare]|nr:chloroplast stem-loop binding protein of 41 kDa b, chloroplastic [Hordeum vulgare]
MDPRPSPRQPCRGSPRRPGLPQLASPRASPPGLPCPSARRAVPAPCDLASRSHGLPRLAEPPALPGLLLLVACCRAELLLPDVQCCAYTGFSIHSMACSVALDDGVLHKVEAAAYWTAVAPNVEEYGSVVARAITSGDENVAKGILWRGVMTVDMLPWGTSCFACSVVWYPSCYVNLVCLVLLSMASHWSWSVVDGLEQSVVDGLENRPGHADSSNGTLELTLYFWLTWRLGCFPISSLLLIVRVQLYSRQTQSSKFRHEPYATSYKLLTRARGLDSKNILITGGTRFVGLFLSRKLVQEGHQVTLFTRGKAPITQQLPGESDAEYAEFSSKACRFLPSCDRKDFDFVKTSLSAKGFNVVYDINGKPDSYNRSTLFLYKCNNTHSGTIFRFIYCSSTGVYLKSDLLPHFEIDAVDPKSRHKGKLETQSLLETSSVNWTSIRPVYIYGPLNYNPVEEWFFHWLKAGRPIPVPNAGNQITQLGHVKDLATAFIKVLGNPKASKQVYNISGSKYVTFDGIARACAKAGGFPEPEIIHYNPKDFDFDKKKAFPFKDQHFFASVEKASKDLGVTPEYDLLDGLTDSYNLDFDRGTFRKEADFTTDDMILGKKLVSV